MNMEIIFTALAITLTQLPGLVLRYIPFSKLAVPKQKKQLLSCYILFFLLQNLILFIVTYNISITPVIYRIAVPLGSTVYFFINCIILRKMFFQHIFVYGMQGNYCFVLHSFAAILLSQFSHHLSPNRQILVQSFIFLLLFVLAAYPLWHFLKNSFYLKISNGHTYYWNIVWLIPALLWFSSALTTMNNSWINTWRQLAARILLGIIIFILWKCINLDFNELEEKFALKSTNKLLHLQMEAINHQAQTIHENDEKIRILRHDLRHHVQMLSALLSSGELASASLLLEQLSNELESTKPIVFCKNPVINSSLLVYITKAQKENIEIISEVDIPENIPWNSNDIALLFANVLENAIHASSKQPKGKREIHITTRYADHKLAITVENLFDGEIVFNAEGMPAAAQEGHGIGMTSVSAIVSKYHGHMVCSHANNLFAITFMFSEHFVCPL